MSEKNRYLCDLPPKNKKMKVKQFYNNIEEDQELYNELSEIFNLNTEFEEQDDFKNCNNDIKESSSYIINNHANEFHHEYGETKEFLVRNKIFLLFESFQNILEKNGG